MPRISNIPKSSQELQGDEEEVMVQDGVTRRIKRTNFYHKIQVANPTGGSGENLSLPTNIDFTNQIVCIGDLCSGYDSNAVDEVSVAINNDVYFNNVEYVFGLGDSLESGEDPAETLGDFISKKMVNAIGEKEYEEDPADVTDLSYNTNFTGTYTNYKKLTVSDIDFFILNSNSHPDNDLTNATTFRNSIMGQWVEDGIEQSTNTWKVVLCHHPPYSSDSTYGSTSYMQLDWAEIGAHMVISGHSHLYERSHKDNVIYVNVGRVGANARSFGTPTPESQVRLSGANSQGYLRLFSNNDYIHGHWVESAGSSTLDSFRIIRQ